MKDRWIKWYQNYQDGHHFRGRRLFGAAARVAAAGYQLGYYLHRRFKMPKEGKVFRPRARVIAVGNLTVGGSGKTPLVNYIGSRLLCSGRRVTILTRGYGRRSKQRIMINPDQVNKYDAELVGDEPLMLARRLPEATVIVDADRAAAACDFERQSSTDVFLLDDAFQYYHIARDRRILTLLSDDLHFPFHFFPAGRWREPPKQATNADAAALVATSPKLDTHADEDTLAALGFAGPVFHFAYELTSWRDLDGTPAGFLLLPTASSVGAFCALARPDQFFLWLGSRYVMIKQAWRFADHCRYRQKDIDALCADARKESLDLLITTQKDAVKLARFETRGIRIIYPEVRLSPGVDAEEFDRFLEQVFDR